MKERRIITEEEEKELEKDQVFQWVAIKALIIDEGKVLLGKRLDEDDHGLFEIPGGKLEVGETFVSTLKREVLEETGVEVEPVDLEESEGKPVFMAQTKSKRRVTLVVLANVKDKTNMVANTDELGEIDFYTTEQVRDLLEKDLIRPVFVSLMDKFAKGDI